MPGSGIAETTSLTAFYFNKLNSIHINSKQYGTSKAFHAKARNTKHAHNIVRLTSTPNEK